MKVIRPTTFVKATHLIDSNLVETVSLWSSGTTYTLGQQVRYGDRIYQDIHTSGTNLNKQPDTSPTWWQNIGPTNQVAMFDQQTSTTSSQASPLSFTLKAPNCDSIALLGVSASTVSVVAREGAGGTILYSDSFDLTDTSLHNWYEYLYEPAESSSTVVITELPPSSTLHIYVTVTGSGTVAVGTCVFGQAYDLGATQYNPKLGIIDYSVKDTDAYGITTFVERAFSKKLSCTLMTENRNLSRVVGVLSSVRAKPTVWIPTDDAYLMPALTVFGFFKDFSIDVAYPLHSLCSLEIEGLT